MTHLSEHEIVLLFLSLALVLGAARLMGELARRFNQPAILGELIAGILLGPTLLGTLLPDWINPLFPKEGGLAVALDGLRMVAIAMFMLVAGMEVDLTTLRRQGRTASVVSMIGILVPLITGFAAAWSFPTVLGKEPYADRLLFAAFIATAMSISALPVIARTLMDLDLYRSDLGMVVIAAAIFNDLVGWLIFAVLIGSMSAIAPHSHSVAMTVSLTLVFVLLVLTVGRWLIHQLLPWIHAHASWPGGFLGFAFTLALLGAACTTWIGIHPIFGAFLTGIALGDSSHVREHTKKLIGQFVSFFFAPLFFASIGLRVNFVAFFDPVVVLSVLLIAMLGKVIGCGLAARWTGVAWREAWSIGFCLNARGAMEIIVGVLALQHGLIGQRLFVALVIMALLTSLSSGPIVRRLVKLERRRRIIDYLSSRSFINGLRAADRFDAIRQLCQAVSPLTRLEAGVIQEAVVSREKMMPTGMGNSIAVPHARVEGLTEPVVGLALSQSGVDFDAPDGTAAQIICLILTAKNDDGAQLKLLADVARTFGNETIRAQIMQAGSYTDFRAILNTQM